MFKGFKPRQDLIGFTAIPNEWFDEVMKSIDNLSELKVVQAVFRKTYGWVESFNTDSSPVYKIDDEISYSQFQEMTGLTSASISEGLKRAIAHGYIVQVEAGNFISGKSSRYRIRTVNDSPQTLEERPQLKGVGKFLPTSNAKVEEEIPPTSNAKVDTTLNAKASSTLDTKVTKESKKTTKEKRADVYEEEVVKKEVYSTADEDKPKRKKNQYQQYKDKEVEKYNANDVCYYFSEKYENVLGVKYSRITNKDRGLAKKMIEDYGAEQTVKTVDYLMQNYRSYISGYPSIAVLYGFRTTLVPSSVKGNSKDSKLAVRETRLTEEEIKKAETDQNVIKW